MSPSNKYAVVFNSTNNALVSWDSMLSTDLPFTEETSALAPNPSVSELSIINSDPTEKLLVLFKIETELMLPRFTSVIFANANSPFLVILDVLSLLANLGILSWDSSEL